MDLSGDRRAVLEAVCDTVVPSLPRDDDPDGFWARSAGDLNVPVSLEVVLSSALRRTRPGSASSSTGSRNPAFFDASRRSREQIMRNVAALGPAPAAGVNALTALTLFLAYGAPDPTTGSNPFWATFGYPGPGGAHRSRAHGRSPRSCPRATSSTSTRTPW